MLSLQSLRNFVIQLYTYSIINMEDISHFFNGKRSDVMSQLLQTYFRLYTIVHLYASVDTPGNRKCNLSQWHHTVAPEGCCSVYQLIIR